MSNGKILSKDLCLELERLNAGSCTSAQGAGAGAVETVAVVIFEIFGFFHDPRL